MPARKFRRRNIILLCTARRGIPFQPACGAFRRRLDGAFQRRALHRGIAAEIALRFAEHHPRKEYERDEVGDRHQAVENIRDVPHRLNGHIRPDKHSHDIQHPVRPNGRLFSAGDVFEAALAVKIPAENGREREKDQADHQNDRPRGAEDAGQPLRKRLHRDRYALQTLYVPCARDDDGEPRHRADDERIEECARHGHEPLTDGFLRLCRGRRDGCGAQPRLVGEDAARDAVLHGDEKAARDAARDRPRVERADKNLCERLRDRRHVRAEDDEANEHIEYHHKGHDCLGNLGDALYAAEQHQPDDDREHHARNDDGDVVFPAEQGERGRRGKDIPDRIGDAVHLRKGADAEQPHAHAEHGKDDGEKFPAPAQPVFNIIKGSAEGVPVGIHFAVFDGEQALRVFGRHAEKGGEPHPKQRARPARDDRRRHADDVARADGGGKRRAQRAEARHFARALLLLEHVLERARQFADGQKHQPHGEIDAHPEDEHDKGDAPHKIVDCLYDLFKCHLQKCQKESRPAAACGKKTAPSFCLRDSRKTSLRVTPSAPKFPFWSLRSIIFLYSIEIIVNNKEKVNRSRHRRATILRKAVRGRGFAADRYPSMRFMSAITLLSMREICTCDTPTISATSLCVMSRKYRSMMIFFSRSGSESMAALSCICSIISS